MTLWRPRLRACRALAAASALAACHVPRAAVSLRLEPSAAPLDAIVTIDEQPIGSLRLVAARGVRLPEGEHRISVERAGYFPWDRLVRADRKPLRLKVLMAPVPD